MTPDDLEQIRAIVRAELAAAAQRAPADAPQGADAGRAALKAFLARKRLVTGQEAAGALLGCPAADAGAADIKHAVGVLRSLGWERCKVARAGVRRWYYRPGRG